MHSMVDTDGPVEVASAKADGQRGEDRTVDLIVNEMLIYGVKVAALQETSGLGVRYIRLVGIVY